MEDDFTLVTRHRRGGAAPLRRQTAPPRDLVQRVDTTDASSQADARAAEIVLERLAVALRVLQQMPVVSALCETIGKFFSTQPTDIAVYGLGSLRGAGSNPLRQLALVECIRASQNPRDAAIDCADIQQPARALAYDPDFDGVDRIVLERLGYVVPAGTEEGDGARAGLWRRESTRPLLYYLPHCPHELTAAVLAAHVGTSGLSSVAMLCNSFAWAASTARSLNGLALEPSHMLGSGAGASPAAALDLYAAVLREATIVPVTAHVSALPARSMQTTPVTVFTDASTATAAPQPCVRELTIYEYSLQPLLPRGREASQWEEEVRALDATSFHTFQGCKASDNNIAQDALPLIRRRRFILYALGTRGDVEPCALLAARLAMRGHDVTFATHRCHLNEWLSNVVRLAARPFEAISTRLHFELTDTPPSGSWRGVSANVETGRVEDWVRQVAENDVFATRADSTDSEPGRVVVAFNLFCLEAFHVAEALHLPAAALASYAMPHTCSDDFIEELACEAPELVFLLQREENVTSGDGFFPMTSTSDVRSWMWPLFSARRWQQLRSVMGLAALPVPRPIGTPLLYGCSNHVGVCGRGSDTKAPLPRTVHITGYWRLPLPPSHAPAHLRAATTHAHANAPPPRPIVFTLGSMLSIGVLSSGEFPALLAGFKRACAEAGHPGVLVVDEWAAEKLVSIGTSVSNCRSQLRSPSCTTPGVVVCSPAQSCVCCPWSRGEADAAAQLQDVWPAYADWIRDWSQLRRNSSAKQHPPLFVWSGDISFSWLFPMSAGVVSHAGSGTVAATMHAGVPMVCCPAIFDQPHWASRAVQLGVCTGCVPFWALLDAACAVTQSGEPKGDTRALDAFCDVVAKLSDPAVCAMSNRLAAALHQEDGTLVACQLLERLAAEWELRLCSGVPAFDAAT